MPHLIKKSEPNLNRATITRLIFPFFICFLGYFTIKYRVRKKFFIDIFRKFWNISKKLGAFLSVGFWYNNHIYAQLDFWYRKRYILANQKSGASVVCRRRYSHFIFGLFQKPCIFLWKSIQKYQQFSEFSKNSLTKLFFSNFDWRKENETAHSKILVTVLECNGQFFHTDWHDFV